MILAEAMALGTAELAEMSTEELRDAYKALSGAATKRSRRLSLAGFTDAPALQSLSARPILVGRNPTVAAYKRAIRNAQNFLNLRTSTLKGAREYFARGQEIQNAYNGPAIIVPRGRAAEANEAAGYSTWDASRRQSFWDVVDNIRAHNPEFFSPGYDSEQAISAIMNWDETRSRHRFWDEMSTGERDQVETLVRRNYELYQAQQYEEEEDEFV